jgi:nucleoside-diphosphate-sugar epimerase
MRIFVTGATGWVGSAVVRELIGAGHQVLGLTRSDKGATDLLAAGADAHQGTLEDLDSLKRGAAKADAVIHTAFNHDFSKIVANSAVEKLAIEAIGTVLQGSDRPFILTSGVALLTPGQLSNEQTEPHPELPNFPRNPESAAAALAERGVRTAIVRLPPSVHGHGDHGFVPILINTARQKGSAAYIGQGLNRWPAVHRLDAARVYRLVLEHGALGGPFHAVAEEGIPFNQIAEVIGRRLNIPIVSKSPEEAAEQFGWFAMFAGLNAPSSSQRTKSILGWQPKQPGLIADMDHEAYFAQ